MPDHIKIGSTDVLIDGDAVVWMPDGLAVDDDGDPRLPDETIDPSGQPETSLRAADGSSVNAQLVPYVAIGGGVGKNGAGDRLGMLLGDYCWIVDLAHQTETGAIWADSSGKNSPKMHEASVAAHQALGWPGDPRGRGGTPPPGTIVIVAIPGSSDGPWSGDVPAMLASARRYYEAWGGPSRLASLIGQPVPGSGALGGVDAAPPVVEQDATGRVPAWMWAGLGAVVLAGLGIALAAGGI